MDLRRHRSARAFLDEAGAYLVANEAALSQIYAIADQLARTASPDAYFATLHDENGVAGAALMTPYRLLVSPLSPDAAAVLADDIGRAFPPGSGVTLPGVLGPIETAQAFARAWCEPRGLTPRTGIEYVAHTLSAETYSGASRAVAGAMRLAGLADAPWIAEGIARFYEEVGVASPEPPHARAARLIEASDVAVWERDGAIVSMAALVGRTPNGRRIADVYTPPEHRRHGYAEAVVAALSRHVLDEIARYCFLYTDASNPTAAAIYRRIGYREVARVSDVSFESS
jgi:hypothetical protein